MCIDLNTIPPLALEGAVPYDASMDVMSSQSRHNGSLSHIAYVALCHFALSLFGIRKLKTDYVDSQVHFRMWSLTKVREGGGLYITTTPGVIMLYATRISCARDGRKTRQKSIHHDKHWFYGSRNMLQNINVEYSFQIMEERAKITVQRIHKARSLKS